MFTTKVREEVRNLAAGAGLDPNAVLAIAEVESAGVPFWTVNGEKMPPVRFEGHYFYRLIPKARRKEAMRLGLAHPKWGVVKNPRGYAARYALIERAMKFDRQAALESCSWGLGQVMGAHWKALGYPNVDALVHRAKDSVAGQVDIMLRFIDKNKLSGYVNQHEWAKFAYRYNGPGYKKNRYDAHMARAYARYAKSGGAVSMNAEWIKRIEALGFDTVRAFQTERGLTADGVIGPITREEVQEAEAEKKASPKDKTEGAGAGAAGVAAGGLLAFASDNWWLIAAGVLVVVAAGGFFWYKFTKGR